MWRRRPPDELTPREREVLRLVRVGLTNEEIAKRLGISLNGARYHVSQILSKLGVATREEAAAWESPERRPWYWKLAWLGGASTVLAAAVGLAAVLSNGTGSITLESEVTAGDITGATSSTPITRSPQINRTDGPPSSTLTPTPSPAIEPDTSEPLSAPTPSRSAETLVDTSELPPLPTLSAPAPSEKPAGKIAFVSGPNGGTAVYLMAADGSGRTSITSGGWDLDPVGSPDGNQIAFARQTSRFYNGWDIFIANADGSGLKKLTSNLGPDVNSGPAWSPDGSRIAFIRNHDLWVMNADGSAAARVFGGAPDYVESGPSWSPDGSRIAFVSTLADHLDSGGRTTDIFTVNEDGSNLATLTTAPSSDVQPTWSPDGTKIAFTSMRAAAITGNYEIHIMNADGSDQAQLTRGGGMDPSWSADGGTIAFVKGDDGGFNLEIYSIAVDGSDESNLTKSPGADFQPHWLP